MTLRERRAAAEAFTTGTARLLLATDAASEGLNLHRRCRLVVNLELPWTPTRLEQRVGRVDRIGQERRVHAIHLVADGTSEQTVVARLLARMQRAGAALDSGRSDASFQERIADAAVGGAPLPRPPALTRLAEQHGVADAGLRIVAAREAESVLRARRLHASPSREPEQRAVLTVVRRRLAPRRYWVFRVEYGDDSGRLLCSTVLGLSAAWDGARRRGRGVVSAALEVDAALRAIAGREHQAGIRRTSHALAPWLRLTRSRQLAIIDTVKARRARLAATLIQPGLFGGGGSRDRDAQAAAADALLGRCEAYLRQIEAARGVTPLSCELVCALLVD
jgi:hypothetical protein